MGKQFQGKLKQYSLELGTHFSRWPLCIWLGYCGSQNRKREHDSFQLNQHCPWEKKFHRPCQGGWGQIRNSIQVHQDIFNLTNYTIFYKCSEQSNLFWDFRQQGNELNDALDIHSSEFDLSVSFILEHWVSYLISLWLFPPV